MKLIIKSLYTISIIVYKFIRLTKITTAQSYHKVRGLYFLVAIFAATKLVLLATNFAVDYINRK